MRVFFCVKINYMENYAYIIFTLGLAAIWIILWKLNPDSRKEIMKVSFWTMFWGLTGPFYVPEYWNPSTIFDLAKRTGFCIEDFLFSFFIGGIVSVFYEIIFQAKHSELPATERLSQKHRFHFWAVVSPPLIFIAMLIASDINAIYSGAIAAIIGFFITWYCRPDLLRKMLLSGFLFLTLYFLFFLLLNAAFPDFVAKTWNLPALSGILIFGIPLEELLFAFTFGLYWSSIYEHAKWKRL